MQFLRVGHTAGQWGRGGWASSRAGGQPAHEEQEEEEEEQCQARAGNTVGHQVKAKEEGSVEVDGQSQAGAVRSRQEGVALLRSGLSFSLPSPGLSCHFSRDVCETRSSGGDGGAPWGGEAMANSVITDTWKN